MAFPRCTPLLAILAFTLAAGAQTAKPAASSVDNDFIQKQFGSTCSQMPGPQPLVADLDGDGIDDVVIVARCTNPMMDESEFGYKVIDPYDGFYGYGDPKISIKFASEDPATRGIVMLVIHGAGAEAWRSEKPKAKFVIINLPFKQLAVKKMDFHKRKIMAIYAEEAHEGEGDVSVIFWDGRKYRYQPMGSTME